MMDQTISSPLPAPKVLLAVSFGTSYKQSRDATIGAIENKLRKAYPDYEVRRAFTSQMILKLLAKRENLRIDNVSQAMERLIADGVRDVIVQPTHIVSGYEYNDLLSVVAAYADSFASVRVGAPLLHTDADYDAVAAVLAEETKTYRAEGAAIILMGHGTGHEANAAYFKLQKHLTAAGLNSVFIATVEAAPALEDVIPLVKARGDNKIVLMPLMIVAGDHANNDMAGDEEDSWKNRLETNGFAVECVLKGLGQYTGIQEIYVRHAAEAVPM